MFIVTRLKHYFDFNHKYIIPIIRIVRQIFRQSTAVEDNGTDKKISSTVQKIEKVSTVEKSTSKGESGGKGKNRRDAGEHSSKHDKSSGEHSREHSETLLESNTAHTDQTPYRSSSNKHHTHTLTSSTPHTDTHSTLHTPRTHSTPHHTPHSTHTPYTPHTQPTESPHIPTFSIESVAIQNALDLAAAVLTYVPSLWMSLPPDLACKYCVTFV